MSGFKVAKRDIAKLYLKTQCDNIENTGDIIDKDFLKGGGFKLETPGLLFPFRKMPQNHPDSLKNAKYDSYNYHYNEKNAATFAYGRRSKKTKKIVRLHAARDLYYDVNEPIYAIADGIVKRVAFFYYDTWVIEIEHEYEAKIAKIKGHKMLVRYGEVKKGSAILVKEGEKVTRGQKIGEIGLLNPYVRQPYPDKRGMLHIEMYTGEGSGNLSDKSIKYSDMLYATSKKNKGITFQRRKDLFDPLDLLNEMIKTSKKENWIE
ncbi:M23 family metallopeptidase [Olleya sp. HaHaR_3_96]|uniref:M23 family metallopeptidase n=1 Tax=Olleya sp. HaHaR_3_96 TaxID=2745560 RepID=UPI001C4F9189|nr:M23 family metallopeptidase [Olleya sp. HaHaR_3_96]QXP58597.1 M23 family metallopeptidase [Olleya sp. HaHaR_3_96]